MFIKISIYISTFLSLAAFAQEGNSLYKQKNVPATSDTIRIEKESINPSYFALRSSNGESINPNQYRIFFQQGYLLFNEGSSFAGDSIRVEYLKYPKSLTKEYEMYDDSQILSNEAIAGSLYKIDNHKEPTASPFDGLNAYGSISRGITVGNNQNAVLNSTLDLQITGKISDHVSLRASLQDTNIPLQDGGYSQKLDQFDNVYMELFSDKWYVRGGDNFVGNKDTYFLNFNKKAQGVFANVKLGIEEENQTIINGSAALVRGVYAKSTFTAAEGNQGPYKLKGQFGELYVLVISGSERVYVNGVLKKRGEDKDYIIDYNAGEITFTALFPITSEMRIAVEYQYSNNKYNRFITYDGLVHKEKNWTLGGFVYSESDIKSQPLHSNLSEEQIAVLANAGDDMSKMTTDSAFEDTYSQNKVLYRKTTVGNLDVYEYSSNKDEVLYNVAFSYMGKGYGNYVLKKQNSIEKIYEFVSPTNGMAKGEYEPVIKLDAPNKIQVANVIGGYNKEEKTKIDFEAAVSNNDANLYSPIDDADNKGMAGKLNLTQRLFTSNWLADVFVNGRMVQDKFRTVERLNNIEFDREWNLDANAKGNQSFVGTGINIALNPNRNPNNSGGVRYSLERLVFSDSYTGNKNSVDVNFNLKNLQITNQTSILNSDANTTSSVFIKNRSLVKLFLHKNWGGVGMNLENNKMKSKETDLYILPSQRYTEYNVFTGYGDSTRVFAEIGFSKRFNDSLVINNIERVNTSNNYWLKSKVVETEKSDLYLYLNYRTLNFADDNKETEQSLNTRAIYNDRFIDEFLLSTTTYETNSGNIAQQEFTYIEVAQGQGVYTWNDYNLNGVQELEEFEVASFKDEAKYIRVFLPSNTYVKTHQTKFSQSLAINLEKWKGREGIKGILHHFYNQIMYITDRKNKNNDTSFELNPFLPADENTLGINFGLQNSLFYNKGMQKHSVTYSYFRNTNKNLSFIGSQEANNRAHQLQYQHLFIQTWIFGLMSKYDNSVLDSQNLVEKNYNIDTYSVSPKISYLFTKGTNLDLFVEWQKKKNSDGDMEKLEQKKIGTSFTYSAMKKATMNGELSYIANDFVGNEFSSVGYKMLEGLQNGKNMTWRFMLQKNITTFLDINFNYQGRTSENSKSVHTGNVQLRAFF